MTLTPVLPAGLLIVVVAALVVLTLRMLARARDRTMRWSWARRLGLVLVVGVIVAQPAFGTTPAKVQTSNLDVIVAVDTTPSIAAEDYDGAHPRLAGVRTELKAIAGSLAGARFALLTFDNDTKQEVPLTTDVAGFDSAVDVLEPQNPTYSGGSSLDQPIAGLTKVLTLARKSDPHRQRMLILVSDGEQTIERPARSFATLSRLISGGAVLGFGTQAGGRMRSYDPDFPDQRGDYIFGPDGADAKSHIDEAALRKAAAQLHIPYRHRTGPARPVAGIAVPKTKYQPASGQSGATARPAYWIAAAGLALLALAEAWHLAAAAGLGRRRS